MCICILDLWFRAHTSFKLATLNQVVIQNETEIKKKQKPMEEQQHKNNKVEERKVKHVKHIYTKNQKHTYIGIEHDARIGILSSFEWICEQERMSK